MRLSPLHESVSLSSLRRNWRSADYYQIHYEYDRIKWAGEWLRRNPEFIVDCQSAPCCLWLDEANKNGDVPIVSCDGKCPLARWGVSCCQVDAEGELRLFWLPHCNPQVLPLDAEDALDLPSSFDPRRSSLLKAVFRDVEGKMHLLFTDNVRTFQIVLQGVMTLERPLLLRAGLLGLHEFAEKSINLRRFYFLCSRDRFLKTLHPGEQRAHYWIKMLRAYDGLSLGATYREIGAAIYGEEAVQDGWEAGYRTRVQRLIRSAKKMINGGYLRLLL